MSGTARSSSSLSKTQPTIALSSAEAELYSSIKLAVEVLGMVRVYQVFGVKMKGQLWGDAPAALGMPEERIQLASSLRVFHA